ncbi:MAG: hypothetical protein H0X24_10505 [Ktedonobacterales bacterium]|nr:hypothetical protein [Ktedonobacterales bacterium]
MSQFTVPPIWLPFPSEESPAAHALEQHALAWVHDMGFLHNARTRQHYQAGKFWFLVAHCFPHGAPAALQVVVEWDSWAFMLDDESDIGRLRRRPAVLRRVLDQLLLVFENKLRHTTPLFVGLQAVWNHMQPWATPSWRGRFRESVARTFAALVWEAENRARGRTPDQSTYIKWRRASSGLATHLDLADFTEGIALSEAVRTHPLIAQLSDCANDVISWTNDLFSLERELAHREVHNLVVVVAAEHHLSLADAFQRVHAMNAQRIDDFLTLEKQLPNFPDGSGVERYINVLHSWMRGNLDWSIATGRYTPVETDQPSQQPSFLDPLGQPKRAGLFSRWRRRDAARLIPAEVLAR